MATDFIPYDSLLVANAEDRIVKLNKPLSRIFDNPPLMITEVKRSVKSDSKVTKVSGFVMDQNGNPVDFVTVFLENAGVFIAGAITNQVGYFEIEAGMNFSNQLKIFVNGKYFTLSPLFLASGKNTELEIRLPNAAGQAYGWTLNTIEVKANGEPHVSYDYASSGGTVTSEEISKMDGIVISALSGKVSGVVMGLKKMGMRNNVGPGSAMDSQQSSTSSATNSGSQKDKFNELFDRIKGDPNANRIRSKFRDYAYFIPNLITDKKGEAHFTVIFPDNQTLWRTVVPAIDYHKRTGLGIAETRAFKPLNATLALPKFYIENDSLKIIGKIFNYTEKEIPLTASFSIDSVVKYSSSRKVKTFLTDSLYLHLPSKGSYDLIYSFETPDKYIDGEKRTLPVYVDDTETVKSINFMAEKDTSFVISPDTGNTKTTVTITNNQLDLLIQQIDKLKNYRFGCNEQTASKLKALLAEKAVLPALGREFKGDKEIVKGIKRLEKSQNKDGSWGWWSNSETPERWMTNYIIDALAMAVKAGFHTRAHIHGAEYLKANLDHFEITEKLYAIEILADFYNKLDYKKQVENFDTRNLSLQDEFRLMRLRQIMGLPVDLKPLLGSMSLVKSGVYWGEEVLDFKTNIIPTSTLAYEVLKNDSLDHKELMHKIRHYFLTHSEMARNTIEQAMMLQSIVGDIMNENRLKQEINPELLLDGRPYTVKTFPHSIKLGKDKAATLVKKGAPLYFSVLSYKLEKNPKAIDSLFHIDTWLAQDSKSTLLLQKAIPASYWVEITTARPTEYVMIEIPIPSSCFYSDKSAGKMLYEVNREYFDDKVVIFCRNLPKGKHRLMVGLQPRFEGRSTLLPVKASLMYYPDCNGINTKKVVMVKE